MRRGDQVERLVPRRRAELARALGAGAHQRRHHPLGAVDALGVALHLLADEALGEGADGRIVDVDRRGVDLDQAAVLDHDLERAAVGAVERAGGAQGRHGVLVSSGCVRAG